MSSLAEEEETTDTSTAPDWTPPHHLLQEGSWQISDLIGRMPGAVSPPPATGPVVPNPSTLHRMRSWRQGSPTLTHAGRGSQLEHASAADEELGI